MAIEIKVTRIIYKAKQGKNCYTIEEKKHKNKSVFYIGEYGCNCIRVPNTITTPEEAVLWFKIILRKRNTIVTIEELELLGVRT